MRSLSSTLSRCTLALLCTLVAVLAWGCDESNRYRSPTAPREPEPPPEATPTATPETEWVSYVGDARLLSSSGPDIACAWFKDVHNTFWFVRIEGDSILLDEEWEIVFTGTIRGRAFTATHTATPPYSEVCPIRETTIEGTFAENFGSFEAEETTAWESAGQVATTVRSWSVQRCPEVGRCGPF